MSRIKQSILQTIPHLPRFLNRALIACNRDPARVYGRHYGDYISFLRDTEPGYDPAPRLLAAVNTAIAHVPYYRERYGPLELDSLTDFEERIGFIDKDVILSNYDDFIAAGTDRSAYDVATTGGTSGKPLKLLLPKNRYVVEMATMHSLWERAGYHFDVRAVIRNHRLPPGETYRINPITREVIFDGFRLTADGFWAIYDVLKAHRIRFVHCYPSTACEFASFLLENRLDATFLTAFLSGSENVFDHQRELIQTRLGVRFYNWYGHSEKLVLAGYCRNSNVYHVEPTYGYFELIDEQGQVVREPGGFGEIVGTALHNPGMPFIRYRTGDFAEYTGDFCPSCGRHVPLIRNIRGRWSGDRVFNGDGSFVTTTALNLHNDLYQVINGIQYLQERKGELTVLIVTSSQYTSDHEAALYRHFRDRLQPDTVVTIRHTDQLMRHANGKFSHIISVLDGSACFPLESKPSAAITSRKKGL